MLLPSKELLSEVLNKNVDKVKDIEVNNLIYGCYPHNGWYDEINIYELAHKCKEWALSKGCALLSGINNKTFEAHKIVCTVNYKLYILCTYKCFYADTEPEAIFKACEWIMEQTK